MHFHRFGAECDGQHLMTEANPECGNTAFHAFADDRYGIFAGCCRITGTVRQEYPVRFQRHNFIIGRRCRDNGDTAAKLRQAAKDIALYAIVNGDDVPFRSFLLAISCLDVPVCFIPFVSGLAGHFLGKVHSLEARPFRSLFGQVGNIELAVLSVGDNTVGCAGLADIVGEAAGIDTGNTGKFTRLEPVIQRADCAPVRRIRDIGANDQSVGSDAGCFDILIIETDIADMWESEGNQLAGKGGVGQTFLITGH